MKKQIGILSLLSCLYSSTLFSKDSEPPGRIPDELESVAGPLLGFSYGGTSAVSGLSSVRSNPAMLIFERKYEVSGSYNWPTYGRDFYQVGVTDSKTASFAAGFLYSSFRERYKIPSELPEKNERRQAFYDSPIKNRLSFALAQPFSNFSAGLGVQIVNSAVSTQNKRGVTLGGGLAGLLTPQLRFGLSVENLANKGVVDIAPTAYRAGLAYVMSNNNLTFHLDYRQRQRVSQELSAFEKTVPGNPSYSPFEKMVIASSSIRIQDLLRLLAGYGVEIGGTRNTLSGGIALVNKNFALSYLIGKSYLKDSAFHQAVNLEIQLGF